jgi:hypothetical protein
VFTVSHANAKRQIDGWQRFRSSSTQHGPSTENKVLQPDFSFHPGLVIEKYYHEVVHICVCCIA